ncbi:unnamed protein product [Vitrella brassicaformis CCMP3155]|uniref:CRAL-TRIO domain-containing protein n=1 Tax=Vitrella brassicaformis (strain CCMP3155) TaxID=1169540 RepID=A0A0G4FYN0_VITBC|nr:unnamed protein product [Vitrella brassicaformis CCMP3155]|eukprot:CEM20323.1 unnamed protein product [Vitrella brassicaformis CCMP3155]
MDERFAQASDFVAHLDGYQQQVTIDDWSRLYGLCKYALHGECTTPRPHDATEIDRRKWEGWLRASFHGSKESASSHFVAIVDSLFPSWLDHKTAIDTRRHKDPPSSPRSLSPRHGQMPPFIRRTDTGRAPSPLPVSIPPSAPPAAEPTDGGRPQPPPQTQSEPHGQQELPMRFEQAGSGGGGGRPPLSMPGGMMGVGGGGGVVVRSPQLSANNTSHCEETHPPSTASSPRRIAAIQQRFKGMLYQKELTVTGGGSWVDRYCVMDTSGCMLRCFDTPASREPRVVIPLDQAVIEGLFSPADDHVDRAAGMWSFVIRWPTDTPPKLQLQPTDRRALSSGGGISSTVASTGWMGSWAPVGVEEDGWGIAHLGHYHEDEAKRWYDGILDAIEAFDSPPQPVLPPLDTFMHDHTPSGIRLTAETIHPCPGPPEPSSVPPVLAPCVEQPQSGLHDGSDNWVLSSGEGGCRIYRHRRDPHRWKCSMTIHAPRALVLHYLSRPWGISSFLGFQETKWQLLQCVPDEPVDVCRYRHRLWGGVWGVPWRVLGGRHAWNPLMEYRLIRTGWTDPDGTSFIVGTSLPLTKPFPLSVSSTLPLPWLSGAAQTVRTDVQLVSWRVGPSSRPNERCHVSCCLRLAPRQPYWGVALWLGGGVGVRRVLVRSFFDHLVKLRGFLTSSDEADMPLSELGASEWSSPLPSLTFSPQSTSTTSPPGSPLDTDPDDIDAAARVFCTLPLPFSDLRPVPPSQRPRWLRSQQDLGRRQGKALADLRRQLQLGGEFGPPVLDLRESDLLRFLSARGWDVDAAELQLRRAIHWRKESGVEAIHLHAEGLKPHMDTRWGHLWASDVHQRPCLVFVLQRITSNNTADPAALRWCLLHLLEQALHQLQNTPHVEQWVVLIDGRGFGYAHWGAWQPLLELLPILTEVYAERLGEVLVWRASWPLRLAWDMLRLLLDETTVQKVRFLPSDEPSTLRVFQHCFPPSQSPLSALMAEEL